MKCRTCGYGLFGIKARQCPECGAVFKPTDFVFRKYAVKYHCPHCEQHYYGTSENGHLEPPQFDCVKCHTRIAIDDMKIMPSDGVQEESTSGVVNPWLRRMEGERRHTILGAWRRTANMGITSPGRLLRVTPLATPTSFALRFCMCTAFVYSMLGVGIFALPLALFEILRLRTPGPGAVMVGQSEYLFLIWLSYLLAPVVVVPVWAAIAHALLWMTGTTAGGYWRTLSCLCFASGANLMSAIPCVACYLGPLTYILWGTSGVSAVVEGQNVKLWRALFAVLGPVLAVILGISGYILVAIGYWK
jgi:predicted RNA-binding Zn-ribbon protein involved in translation (DUF1610 family)